MRAATTTTTTTRATQAAAGGRRARRSIAVAVTVVTAVLGPVGVGSVASAQTPAPAAPPDYSATYRIERTSSTSSSSTTTGSSGSSAGTATIRLDCTDATACKIAEFVSGGPSWIGPSDLLPFSITAVGSSGAVEIPNCEGARVSMNANLEPVGTATVSGARYPASVTGTIEASISEGTDPNGAVCGNEKWTFTFAKSATTGTTVPSNPAFTPNPKKKVSLQFSGDFSATLNGNKANCLGDLVGISGRNYPALGADGFLEFRRDSFSRGNIDGEIVTGDPPVFTKKNTILTFDTTLTSTSSSSPFEVLLQGRIKCARFPA